jgi:predicted Rossmann fold nucleotide-binding protein DprA/Smf involved in DNA uptake
MDAAALFGENAGKVWSALKEGPKTLTQIQKASNLTVKEASMGLGWLAREGKVTLRGQGLYQKFELAE